MTAAFDDWLPLGAFDDRRVTATILSAVESWSARWFVRPLAYSATTTVRSHVANRAGQPGARWMSFGNAVMFRWSDHTGAALARLAIDAPTGRAETASGDARLLESLGEAMAMNLAADLTAALQLQNRPAQPMLERRDPLTTSGGIEIEALAGVITPSIRIAISAGALVGFRKSVVRSFQSPPPRLTPLVDAFDRETVAYSAILGQAKTSLADVQGLEVGDLVLLDTGLADLIPVVSSKSGTMISAARVSQQQGRIQLVLETTSGSSK